MLHVISQKLPCSNKAIPSFSMFSVDPGKQNLPTYPEKKTNKAESKKNIIIYSTK